MGLGVGVGVSVRAAGPAEENDPRRSMIYGDFLLKVDESVDGFEDR
jgi:hypothetical protein